MKDLNALNLDFQTKDRKHRPNWKNPDKFIPCPFCGADVEKGEPDKVIDLSNRLTARDENGIPYYCGEHTFHSFTYAQDMSITAIAEILEKLCQYEEIEEDKNLNEEENNNGEG